MANAVNYFLINSGTKGGEAVAEEWASSVLPHLVCECGLARAAEGREGELYADLACKPGKTAVNSIGMTVIGIMQKKLFALLAPYSKNKISFGEARVNGVLLQDYVSYINEPIGAKVPRGGVASMHRYCQVCKRLNYIGIGRRYLLSGQTNDNAPLYATNTYGIILREDICDAAKKVIGRSMKVHKLSIADAPKDGLEQSIGWER